MLSAPSGVDRSTIVVVDDDRAVRAALVFALELEGFDVEVRCSGEELLSMPLPRGDACLVVDERMPGLGGLATLDLLRRRNVTLPALLITTHPNRVLREAARVAGVAIVEKPLIGDALLRSIREALRV